MSAPTLVAEIQGAVVVTASAAPVTFARLTHATGTSNSGLELFVRGLIRSTRESDE